MNKKTLTVAIAAAMFATTGAALAAPTSPDGGVTVAPSVTVRAEPFSVHGTIPAVCFAADAKSNLAADLSPEAGAAAASILDAALAFAVVDFDAVGVLASERHGSSQG